MQLPQTAVIDFHNYISNIMYNIVASFIEVIVAATLILEVHTTTQTVC
jgi:hypothetical protein